MAKLELKIDDDGYLTARIKLSDPKQSSTGKTMNVAYGQARIEGPDGTMLTVQTNVYFKTAPEKKA